MSLSIPSEVRWLFKIVVGEEWPLGDEAELRRMGATYDTAAADFDRLVPLLENATRDVLSAIQGESAEEYRTFMTNLGTQLPPIVTSAKQMADLSRKTALEIEYTKYMIIGSLILLAQSIAAAMSAAFFTFGASTAAIPAMQTATRIIVKKLFLQLLKAVMWGVIQQVGLDAAIQAIQMLKGDRTSWDWEKTKGAAMAGAVGGVIGFGLGQAVSRFAPRLDGKILTEVVKGGSHEVLTGLAVDKVNRSSETDWSAFTAGATEGVFDGIKGRSGGNSNAASNIAGTHVTDIGDVVGAGGIPTVPGVGSDDTTGSRGGTRPTRETSDQDTDRPDLPGSSTPQPPATVTVSDTVPATAATQVPAPAATTSRGAEASHTGNDPGFSTAGGQSSPAPSLATPPPATPPPATPPPATPPAGAPSPTTPTAYTPSPTTAPAAAPTAAAPSPTTPTAYTPTPGTLSDPAAPTVPSARDPLGINTAVPAHVADEYRPAPVNDSSVSTPTTVNTGVAVPLTTTSSLAETGPAGSGYAETGTTSGGQAPASTAPAVPSTTSPAVSGPSAVPATGPAVASAPTGATSVSTPASTGTPSAATPSPAAVVTPGLSSTGSATVASTMPSTMVTTGGPGPATGSRPAAAVASPTVAAESATPPPETAGTEIRWAEGSRPPAESGSTGARSATEATPGHSTEATPDYSLGSYPESVHQLDQLVTDITAGIPVVLNQFRRNAEPQLTVARLPKKPDIGDALTSDWESFFTSGGRSFDMTVDGRLYTLNVTPVPRFAERTSAGQSAASSEKVDSRTDIAGSSKTTHGFGPTGAISAAFSDPATAGLIGGGGVTVETSRRDRNPQKAEDSTKITDMSTVRSGSGSELWQVPTTFRITATEVVARGDGAQQTGTTEAAAQGDGAQRTRTTEIEHSVLFRRSKDVADAKDVGDNTPVTTENSSAKAIQKYTSALVDYFVAEKVGGAAINGRDGSATWNDAVDHILQSLSHTGVTAPGTRGTQHVRDVITGSTIVEYTRSILAGEAVTTQIPSPHGRHAVHLAITGGLKSITPLKTVTKSTVRSLPATVSSTKVSQDRKVGGEIYGYAGSSATADIGQGRAGVGGTKSLTHSVTESSAQHVGYELKGIRNVLAKVTLQLTVQSDVTGGNPTTIDVDVIGRIPENKFEAIRDAFRLDDTAAQRETEAREKTEDLKTKQTVEKAALGVLGNATTTKEAAGRELAVAEQKSEDAKAESEAAEAESEAAKTQLSNARIAKDEADEKLTAAQAAAEKAREAAEKTDTTEAAEKPDDGRVKAAEKSVEDATRMLDEAKQAAAAAEQKAQSFAVKATEAARAFTEAKRAFTEAESAFSEAARELHTASENVKEAEESADKADNAAKAAREAADKDIAREQPDGPLTVPPFAESGGRFVMQGLDRFSGFNTDVRSLINRIHNGFLPSFTDPANSKPQSADEAKMQERNMRALSQVLSPLAVGIDTSTLLGNGLTARLFRPGRFGPKFMTVRVTGRFRPLTPNGPDFQYLGREENFSVRTVQKSTTQHKSVKGRQFKASLGGSVGKVHRSGEERKNAVSGQAGVALQGQHTRQSSTQHTTAETRVNGGTPAAEAFRGKLELTVSVVPYQVKRSLNLRERQIFSKIVRRFEPRDGTLVDVGTTLREPPAFRDPRQNLTEYPISGEQEVTLLFDQASVLPASPETASPETASPKTASPAMNSSETAGAGTQPASAPPEVRDGPLRMADFRLAHDSPQPGDWLSVESFPSSKRIQDLASDAVSRLLSHGDRRYPIRVDGVPGAEAVAAPGMPTRQAMEQRMSAARQTGALRRMLQGVWKIGNIADVNLGAGLDVAVRTSLRNPAVVAVRPALITTENATSGGVEVEGSRTWEGGVTGQLRAADTTRDVGTKTQAVPADGNASFGDGSLEAGKKWIDRNATTVSGGIERNRNNRTGDTQSYLVKFDAKVTVGAQLTWNRFAAKLAPKFLRPRSFTSVTVEETFPDAVYLRLNAEQLKQVDPDGLAFPGLTDDALWNPQPLVQQQSHQETEEESKDSSPVEAGVQETGTADDRPGLHPDRSIGLGLYTVVQVEPVAAELLDLAATKLGRYFEGAARAESFADPMLYERRLHDLLSPDTIARHFADITDGGISLLRLDPTLMKSLQGHTDIRLVATRTEVPEKVIGFRADNDDLDVKLTHVRESGNDRTGKTAKGGRIAGTHTDFNGGGNQGAVTGGGVVMGGGASAGVSGERSRSRETGVNDTVTQVSSARGVKARVEFPMQYDLRAYRKGDLAGTSLATAEGSVTQDRWADELRHRSTGAPPIVSVQPVAPVTDQPGWSSAPDALPLPPRFVPEDIRNLGDLQNQATLELSRLASSKAASVDLDQIRQMLSPQLLLPGVTQMLTKDGLDLPRVKGTGVRAPSLALNIRLVPDQVRLDNLSSKVYREHSDQHGESRSHGRDAEGKTNVGGHGYAGQGRSGSETDNMEGVTAGGTTTDSAASGLGSAEVGADFENVKPENRSALLNYGCQVVITGKLGSTFASDVRITGRTSVFLRMSLDEARRAMGLTEGAQLPMKEKFDAIDKAEASVSEMADKFVKESAELQKQRFLGTGDLAVQAGKRQDAGQAWWDAVQKHGQQVDEFRQSYQGVAQKPAPADSTGLRDLAETRPGDLATAPPKHQETSENAAGRDADADGRQSYPGVAHDPAPADSTGLRNLAETRPGDLATAQPEHQETLENAVGRDADGRPLIHQHPNQNSWAGLVNDGGRGVFGRANNCADTSLSFLSTWFGRPVVSGSRTAEVSAEKDSTARQERTLGATFQRSPGSNATEMLDAVAGRLREAGHGAAAVLITAGTPPEGAASHSWNAVNHKGDIVWVDAQDKRVENSPIHLTGVHGVWSIVLDAEGKPIEAGTAVGDRPAQATGVPDPADLRRSIPFEETRSAFTRPAATNPATPSTPEPFDRSRPFDEARSAFTRPAGTNPATPSTPEPFDRSRPFDEARSAFTRPAATNPDRPDPIAEETPAVETAPQRAPESVAATRVRNLLAGLGRVPDQGGLPERGIAVMIDEAANFGHQAAGLTLADSLRELGYPSPVRFITTSAVQAKLATLGSTELTVEQRPRFEDEPENNPGAADGVYRPELVVIAAADGLSPTAATGQNLLNYLNTDTALVLQPYAWQAGKRMIFHREAGGQMTDDGVSVLGDDTINDYALYRYPVPPVTSADDADATLTSAVEQRILSAEQAAGLRTVSRVAFEAPERWGSAPPAEVMPVYGLHRLEPSERHGFSGGLARAVQLALPERRSLVVEIGGTGIAYAPPHPGQQTVDLTDPELAARIEAMHEGAVLVVRAGALPQPVFQMVYQLGTLPAVLEGANTANLAQLLGRPYFTTIAATEGATTMATRFPLSSTNIDDDSAAIEELEAVTASLMHKTAWAEDLTYIDAYGRLARAGMLKRTFQELHEFIVDNGGEGTMGVEYIDELRQSFAANPFNYRTAYDQGLADVLDGVLADTPEARQAISKAMDSDFTHDFPVTAANIVTLLERIEQRITTLEGEVREQSSESDTLPPDNEIANVVQAIRDLRPGADSGLRRYADRVAEAAQSEDRDQVLQGLLQLLDRGLLGGGAP